MEKKQKGFVIPLILITTIILIIGIFFVNRDSTKTEKTVAIATTDIASTKVNSNKVLSPKETWLEFRTKFSDTKNFEEAWAVSLEYATEETITDFNNNPPELTPEMDEEFFNEVKSMTAKLDSIIVGEEKIIGNNATIEIKMKDNSETGIVSLVKENGIWKIVEEAWE